MNGTRLFFFWSKYIHGFYSLSVQSDMLFVFPQNDFLFVTRLALSVFMSTSPFKIDTFDTGQSKRNEVIFTKFQKLLGFARHQLIGHYVYNPGSKK